MKMQELNSISTSHIDVKNISKLYKIYRGPKNFIAELLTGKSHHTQSWALKDISFDVKQGEVVGIIGRNGAGKSTLLRIISNTLDATTGDLNVSGKISAIMILGTGFHMELTGRENILMGGLCLGMTHAEIKTKTDWIINFSGLQKSIDQPCKGYSSGMLQRLAFSVAAAVEPQILIIDEALAVGDAAFVAKSYTHMRKIAKNGSTVLFVSHCTQSIYDLCDKAILLDQGKIVKLGSPKAVIQTYEDMIEQELKNQKNREPVASLLNTNDSDPATRKSVLPSQKSQESIRSMSIMIFDENGKETRLLHQDKTYTIQLNFSCTHDLTELSAGYAIRSMNGTCLYETSSSQQNKSLDGKKNHVVRICFNFLCRLAANTYLITYHIKGKKRSGAMPTEFHFMSEPLIIKTDGLNVFNGFVDLKSTIIHTTRNKIQENQ